MTKLREQYKNKMRSSTKRWKAHFKTNQKFGVREYNDCTEEFNRELQEQTVLSRRQNQKAQKKII